MKTERYQYNKGSRLRVVQATLTKHGIPYDFSQDPDGNAGIRWHYKGQAYSVMQKNGNAGLIASHNITKIYGISQGFVCKFIDHLIETEG